MHASWQQEIFAAHERARRHIDYYMGGAIEVVNPGSDIMLVASGSAVSQAREAVRQAEENRGVKIGLVKVKSIRPYPKLELIAACKHAKKIIVPEFNYVGWHRKEVKDTLYGHSNAEVTDGPRVFGGMSMPTEMILDYIFPSNGKKF